MKNKTMKALALLASIACGVASCADSGKGKTDLLGELPVIGAVEVVNGDSVWVCHLSKLSASGDTLILPLSALTEEMQIVKLDDRDEALTPVTNTLVSDNYILVYGRDQIPFKLFDKSGHFLCNVGSVGQGPGEYNLVYDAQIDEKAGRIYLLPWNARTLLAYDLQGALVEEIPLPTLMPKGKFHVDSERSTASFFNLPFDYLPYTAWTQDLSGRLLDSIPAKHLAVEPDFSNEVTSNKLGGTFDVSLFTFFELRPDTLYHFEQSRLKPRFTLDFGSQPAMIHLYGELPRHFIGDVTLPKQIAENSFITEEPSCYIMDKATLRGNFYKLVNDYLGNMPAYLLFSCQNGYYVRNLEPGQLKEALEKQLNGKEKLTAEERNRLQTLLDGIRENDNNYIFYAKLK